MIVPMRIVNIIKKFLFLGDIIMIKIAHVQLLPLLTGVQRVSLDELSRLNKCDFESYIICKEYGPLIEECIKNNIKFIYCKNLVRNISITQDFRAFWCLYKLFKKINLILFIRIHPKLESLGV